MITFNQNSILIFLTILLWAGIFQSPSMAETARMPPVLSETDQGLLVLESDNLALKHIVARLKTVKKLSFTGLSDYMEEKVTLSHTGTAAEVVKKILKSLMIHNYAYIFNGEQLAGVTVLPSAKTSGVFNIQESSENEPLFNEERTFKMLNSSTVLIQKVVPGSQGETLDLAIDDYIVAYNGHKVQNVGKLIQYVRKYKEEESVSLVIVRDERVLEYTLNGGLIGVQIVTVPMNFDILENYYRQILLE